MEYITKNARETQLLAKKIIEDILAKSKKFSAAVLALEGELGSGKTTFAQGLGEALGIGEKILSPTFVILKHFGNFYHMDAYRLSGEKDLAELNFGEILKEPKNIVAVEWAERIKKALPENTIWIKFEHAGEDKRKIKIKE